MTHPTGSAGVDALGATHVGNEPPDVGSTRPVCEVGRTYAGQYLVKGLLGQGGMGEVYLVEHQILRADFALKVLRPTYRIRADIVQRFRAESRALWELSHPNFVRVHHAGDDPEIGPYMAMEVLRGKTLAQFMHIVNPLAIGHALALGIEIADTAEAMHQLGIIHRDLKPDNLFLTVRGQNKTSGLKLLDLGAAKIAKYGGPATAENRTIGTGRYMSPEHIRSQPLGPQSDIYALGHILYEIISGAPVFGAHHPNPTHFDYQLWHLNAEPEPLSARVPSAPPDLCAVLAQAMAKVPAHRFQSMAAFATALREVLRRYLVKGGTEQMSGALVDQTKTIEDVLSAPSPDGQWSFPARAVASPNGTSTAEAVTPRDPVSKGLVLQAQGAVTPLPEQNPAPRRASGSLHTIRMDLPGQAQANGTSPEPARDSAPPSFTQMSAVVPRASPVPTQAMVAPFGFAAPQPVMQSQRPVLLPGQAPFAAASPVHGPPPMLHGPPPRPVPAARSSFAVGVVLGLLVIAAIGALVILRATGRM